MNKECTKFLSFVLLASLSLFPMDLQIFSGDFSILPEEVLLNICAKLRNGDRWEMLILANILKKVCKSWYVIFTNHANIANIMNLPPMHCAAALGRTDDIVRLKMQEKCSLRELDEAHCTPGDYAVARKQNASRKTLQIAFALEDHQKFSIQAMDQQYIAEDLADALMQDSIDQVETTLLQSTDLISLVQTLFPFNTPSVYAEKSSLWSERCKQRVLYAMQGALEHTAFTYCAQQEEKFTEEFRTMIYTYSANINAYNVDGRTLLHKACADIKKFNILQFLLQCEDINVNRISKEIYEGRQLLPTPLHIAIEENNNNAVKALLATNKCKINAVNIDGETALHRAILENNITNIKMLLKHGADIYSKNKLTGATPLHYAVQSDSTSTNTLELLCSLPLCNIDIEDNNGKTPLSHAVQIGNVTGMKYLLDKKADITIKSCRDNTLLHFAVFSDNSNIFAQVLLLLKNAVNSTNHLGETPLHYAAAKGYTRFVRPLIEANASINKQNNEGGSPLHYAVYKRHLDFVKELIQKKADVTLQTQSQTTALDIAKGHNHHEIVNFLASNT